MSDEAKKDGNIVSNPKETEEAESQELGAESLDGVVGGLGLLIPGITDATSLSSTETAVCISQ